MDKEELRKKMAADNKAQIHFFKFQAACSDWTGAHS